MFKFHQLTQSYNLRVYEQTIEYLESPSKLLTEPFSTKFALVEEEPVPTKNKKSFFSK